MLCRCSVICNAVQSLKTWFSYVGKIQDDRGFYFCLTVPDFADILGNCQKSYEGHHVVCVIGGLEPWATKRISIADAPDGINLSFHSSEIIADHQRNVGLLGRCLLAESLSIYVISNTKIQQTATLLPFRKRFLQIRLESKWNATFLVVPAKIFPEATKRLKR